VIPALSIRAAAVGPVAGRWTLGAVELELRPGERVALLGANGAGKTTLLRAAMGLARLREGDVRVAGMRVRTPEEAVRAGAGLVLQNPEDQLLGATVLEDAMIGPLHAGLAPAAARARAREALAAVGLAGAEDRPVEELSFGEKRRLGLAAVLVMRPSLLLLDEPTSGLDPLGEQEIAALLARAAGAGATLLVATHAVDLVPSLADRAVVLGGGCVLADGPVAQIFSDATLLARARLRAPHAATLQPPRRAESAGAVSPPFVEVPAWNADPS
jgi:cobalt/nickel transport system ATP-binding protein